MAMNLAYNTSLKTRARLELAQQGPSTSLPLPCDAVRLWHTLARSWLLQSNTHFWVSIHSSNYPQGLLNLKDPPLILFGQGNAALLQTRAIAMVGSRNATRAGMANAHGFAQAFVREGWAVVSGLAEGIDGAAHAGALEALGATIAVLGCGPDETYPKHHSTLKQRIAAEGGLILSEYPPGTAPQPAFFPRRNRIIAALSDALLVVDAAPRSGSLITARVASELGRPVGAIPGSIHNSQSKGCHAMIKQGALLVETAQELTTEALAQLPLHKQPCQARHSNHHDRADEHAVHQRHASLPTLGHDLVLDAELIRILDHLGTEPLHADALAGELNLSPEDALAALTELELLVAVLCEPGNRWISGNGVL